MDEKKILGKFYIDVSSNNRCRNKKLIVNTINSFINKYPTFSPISNDLSHINIKFKEYAKFNEMNILEISYYGINISKKLIDTDSYIINRRNDLCVMRDKNGVNHIMVIRNYSNVKEIDSNLNINTLYNIYESFVFNILDLKFIIRMIKEINTIFSSKFLNTYFFNVQESHVICEYFTNFKFDKDKIKLRVKFIQTYYDFNSHYISQYNTCNSYYGISSILKFFNNRLSVNFITNKDSDISKFLIDSYNNFNKESFDKLNNAIDTFKRHDFENNEI